MANVETVEFCGKFYFRGSPVLMKGEGVPRHRHDVSHPTLCGSGSAEYFVDGELKGTIKAGEAKLIDSGVDHWFIALEDNTRLFCVFNADEVEKEQ